MEGFRAECQRRLVYFPGFGFVAKTMFPAESRPPGRLDLSCVKGDIPRAVLTLLGEKGGDVANQ